MAGRSEMRELKAGAIRSKGRDQHRARYAAYISSSAWFARREEWAAEAVLRAGSPTIHCTGCKKPWKLDRDDLHHVTYDRLEHELHEDLWPLCRQCHTTIHELMDSSKAWRRLSRRHANELAIAKLRDRIAGGTPAERQARAVRGLRDFL